MDGLLRVKSGHLSHKYCLILNKIGPGDNEFLQIGKDETTGREKWCATLEDSGVRTTQRLRV